MCLYRQTLFWNSCLARKRLQGPDLGWMPDKYRAAVVATDGVRVQWALLQTFRRWSFRGRPYIAHRFRRIPQWFRGTVMQFWKLIRTDQDYIHQVCLQGLSCFESRPHKWRYQPNRCSTQMENLRFWIFFMMFLCSMNHAKPRLSCQSWKTQVLIMVWSVASWQTQMALPDPCEMENIHFGGLEPWGGGLEPWVLSTPFFAHHILPHRPWQMNLQHYIACIITCFLWVYVLFSLFWMVCVEEAFWIIQAIVCLAFMTHFMWWLCSDRAMLCFIVGAPDQCFLPDLCSSRPGLWRRRGAPIMPIMVVSKTYLSQFWLEIHDRPNTVPSFKVTMDVSMAHLATLPRLHHLSGYTGCMSFHSLCYDIPWSYSKFVQVICIDPIAPDADFIGRSQFCG